MLVVPSIGATYLLDQLLTRLVPWVHLFTNYVPLGPNTQLNDLVEPNYAGYAPVPVTTWTASILVGPFATSYADPQVFTRGLGGTTAAVYGYFVTDAQGGPLCWAEASPNGPIVFDVAGVTLIMSPCVQLMGLT